MWESDGLTASPELGVAPPIPRLSHRVNDAVGTDLEFNPELSVNRAHTNNALALVRTLAGRPEIESCSRWAPQRSRFPISQGYCCDQLQPTHCMDDLDFRVQRTHNGGVRDSIH